MPIPVPAVPKPHIPAPKKGPWGILIGIGVIVVALIALGIIASIIRWRNDKPVREREAKALQAAEAALKAKSAPIVRPIIPWEKVKEFKHECKLRAGETSADFHITPNHWAKLKVSDWGKPGIKFFVVYNGTKKLQPQPSGELPKDDHVSYFALVSDSLESILFTVEETPM